MVAEGQGKKVQVSVCTSSNKCGGRGQARWQWRVLGGGLGAPGRGWARVETVLEAQSGTCSELPQSQEAPEGGLCAGALVVATKPAARSVCNGAGHTEFWGHRVACNWGLDTGETSRQGFLFGGQREWVPQTVGPLVQAG